MGIAPTRLALWRKVALPSWAWPSLAPRARMRDGSPSSYSSPYFCHQHLRSARTRARARLPHESIRHASLAMTGCSHSPSLPFGHILANSDRGEAGSVRDQTNCGRAPGTILVVTRTNPVETNRIKPQRLEAPNSTASRHALWIAPVGARIRAKPGISVREEKHAWHESWQESVTST